MSFNETKSSMLIVVKLSKLTVLVSNERNIFLIAVEESPLKTRVDSVRSISCTYGFIKKEQHVKKSSISFFL